MAASPLLEAVWAAAVDARSTAVRVAVQPVMGGDLAELSAADRAALVRLQEAIAAVGAES